MYICGDGLKWGLKYTVVVKWRSPADRVVGLSGLTVEAHCLSGYSIHHFSLRINYLFNKGLSWGWDKEFLQDDLLSLN